MDNSFNSPPNAQSRQAADLSFSLPAGQANHGFLDLSTTESSVSAERFPNQSNIARRAGSSGSSGTLGASAAAGTTAKHTGATRVRRRNRLITSCLECRRRKLKCDRSAPCSNCIKNGRECLFIASTNDSTTQSKIAELKEKMGSLERGLEKDIAKKHLGVGKSSDGNSFTEDGGQGSAVGAEREKEEGKEEEDEEDHEGLEPSPLVTTDAAYEENPDDDLVDLGVQLGKMRITDRIGGLFRPKFADEVRGLLFCL